MPGISIFLDSVNYPQVNKLTRGQRVSITMSGTVENAGRDGVNFKPDKLTIGKKQKMSTQEILFANQLDRIEAKLPGVATRV